MENKYYTPTIEELLQHIVNEKFIYTYLKSSSNDGDLVEIRFESDTVNSIHDFIEINDVNGDIYSINPELYRIKYLDQEDIESLGFEKAFKNQWIGWSDYYSGNVSGKYGYFLYVTLHVPRLYNKSSRLEDNLFKIIIHRHYTSNEDETTSIEEKLEQNESEVIFKGIIKNKSELKQVLKMIGVIE